MENPLGKLKDKFKKKEEVKIPSTTINPEELPIEEQEPKKEQVEEQQVIEEPKMVQVPVFVSQEDINRLTYENNIILKEVLRLIKE